MTRALVRRRRRRRWPTLGWRRALVFFSAWALVVDLAAAQAAAAQTKAPLELVDLDTTSRPYVTVTVAVPRELAAAELGPQNFTVTEDGEPRKAAVTRVPGDTLEVVLVIDASGSMLGEPLAAAKAAAQGFVAAMPAGTRIAVVGFGNAPDVVAGFGRDELTAAIDGLTAKGETALYDAVVTGVEQFAAGGEGAARRYTVLLSDGGDTASARTIEEAVAALTAADTGFSAVALATAESDLGALGQLAQATGGKVVAASDPSELAAAYDAIAGKIVNQYEVRYRSEAEGKTRVEVEVAADGVVAEWRDTVDFDPLPAPEMAPAPEPPRPSSAGGPGLWAQAWWLYIGVVPVGLALFIASWLLLATRRPRPRRRLARELGVGADAAPSAFTGLSERASALAERVLARGGRSSRLNAALERAGLMVRPGEFVVAAGSVVIAGSAAALLVFGALGAVVVTGGLGAAAWFGLAGAARRRQRRLADQLGDTLQLLAGSLRSGHGLIQALDMVTREAESPTAEEFHRVIVEARLGRDLSDALDALARRSGSEDMEWVVQAIRIHREVGGDLAEILDRVGETIRDRNRVRGQVRSLTAEGRLSAIILMALPFLVGAWMWFTNRPYVAELFERSEGRMLLGVGGFLMTMGAVVMKRLVKPEF
ncbi:MAG: type II secretion system F family protein [Actinobacteria bacterium]|nr:type II secretion system F family protein [Actinomycetota bacterium]